MKMDANSPLGQMVTVCNDSSAGGKRARGSTGTLWTKDDDEGREPKNGASGQGSRLQVNADRGLPEVRQFCELDDAGKQLMRAAMKQMNMSARAFHRILKLARTIADLEGCGKIETHHLAEAVQYRPRAQG
jgi:hypothetical protein